MSNREKQMDGKTPLEQALKAISHTLGQIQTAPHVAWYLGIGTQTFALLTEAYASIMDEELEDAAEAWTPMKACDPREEGRLEAINAAMENVTDDDDDLSLSQEVEQLAIADRLELLQELRDAYCFRCGGRTPVKPCYCQPVKIHRELQLGGSR